MIKIFQNKETGKTIAIEMETGEIFEEIGEPAVEIEIPKKTRKGKKGKVAKEEKVKQKKQEKKGKRWSRKYDQCQECGTTETKHRSDGLCVNCYNRKFRKQKSPRDKNSKWSKKTYQKEDGSTPPPISSAANNFLCNGYGHTFQSVMEENEVLCPNCESEHCKIIK